jgi:protein phosphatase
MRAVPNLIELALLRGGPKADNCTAVAVTWAGIESVEMVPPTEGPVSTLMIPEGSIASTVQIPRDGEISDVELTEDQIDDAVAEINRAIARSAQVVRGR